MQGIDLDAIREQAAIIMQGIMAGENLDLVISGALLLAIVALSLASVWRNRVPAATVAAPPSAAGRGLLRWLMPKATKSVTAAPTAMVAQAKRTSGSHKTMRVITPVSKVPMKALKVGADLMEIARKSGLSRDGVAMMMAAAAPRSAARPTIEAQASTRAAARQPGNEQQAGRAMMAPGAYTQAQRVIPAKVERGAVGTRYTARLG